MVLWTCLGLENQASEETVDNMPAAFQRSSQKSISGASRELQVPKSTIHNFLRKRLRFLPYQLQIIQALQPNDPPRRFEFAAFMLQKIKEDNEYLRRVMLLDESTFFVSGCVDRHNVRRCDSANPHTISKHIRGNLNVNLWCALMNNNVVGPIPPFEHFLVVTLVSSLGQIRSFQSY